MPEVKSNAESKSEECNQHSKVRENVDYPSPEEHSIPQVPDCNSDDSSALMEKIRIAFQEKSLDKALEYSELASKSPNPRIRSAAVALLKSFVNGGYSINNVLSSCDDDSRIAIINCLKKFAFDEDAEVREKAINTWCISIWGVNNQDLCTSLFDDAFAIDVDFLKFAFRSSPDGWNLIPKIGILTALSRKIEKTGEGDERGKLENEYFKITNAKFSGMKGTDDIIDWYRQLKDLGVRLYDSEDKGNNFVKVVLYFDRSRPGTLDKFSVEDIENVCLKCSQPSKAILYLSNLGNLDNLAKERFDNIDSAEAKAWISEEKAALDAHFNE